MRAALFGAIFTVASCAPKPETPASSAAFRPTAIVLHSTSGLDRRSAVEKMNQRGTGVHYLVDPDARLVMVYMIQQMPNRTDLAQLIPALVYQALTDPPRTK